jgi:hypothetical protein
MTWQAPLAWLGLITIALPILIHLLGQGRARRLPFPSLQFFGATRPLPTRRTRLHDLLLLAVRVAILVAAVAALAQPLLLTPHRRDAFNTSLARAVVVDTSSSMQRNTAAGERAIDVALRESQPLADSAAAGIVLHTANPAGAIAGAVAWLNRQAGRSELLVVSDFQVGAFDSVDLAAIPPHIGVRLVPVRAPLITPLIARTDVGSGTITAHIALSPERTDVEWTQDPAVLGDVRNDVRLLTGPGEESAATAARDAAATVGVPLPLDSNRRISIVYPDYPERAALLQRAKPLRSIWMTNLVSRIGADSTVTVATDSERLLLFPAVDAGSAASATLIAAVRRALSVAPPISELDPASLPDSTLAAWQRSPVARTTPGPGADSSDGRWLWIVALILLAIESMLRRQTTSNPATEVARDAAS